MARGIRESEQSSLWVAAAELPQSPGPPFDTRLTALLDAHAIDPFVEGLCRGVYAQVMGRPSFAPGRYCQLLLGGDFEGLEGGPTAARPRPPHRRDPCHDLARHRLDRYTPRDGTARAHVRPPGANPGRAQRRLQAAGVPTRFLHDGRRTAARNLIRASVPERVAMLLTGYKRRALLHES